MQAQQILVNPMGSFRANILPVECPALGQNAWASAPLSCSVCSAGCPGKGRAWDLGRGDSLAEAVLEGADSWRLSADPSHWGWATGPLLKGHPGSTSRFYHRPQSLTSALLPLFSLPCVAEDCSWENLWGWGLRGGGQIRC